MTYQDYESLNKLLTSYSLVEVLTAIAAAGITPDGQIPDASRRVQALAFILLHNEKGVIPVAH